MSNHLLDEKQILDLSYWFPVSERHIAAIADQEHLEHIKQGWKSPEEIKQFFKELESNGDYDTMEAYMKFKAKWLGVKK